MTTKRRPKKAGGQARDATVGPIRVGSLRRFRAWKLEDAKAKFSEVVRRARAEGPQRVTYRGKNAVVVIAVDDYAKILPPGRGTQRLVQFLRGTALGEIDVGRVRDRGRDLAL